MGKENLTEAKIHLFAVIKMYLIFPKQTLYLFKIYPREKQPQKKKKKSVSSLACYLLDHVWLCNSFLSTMRKNTTKKQLRQMATFPYLTLFLLD